LRKLKSSNSTAKDLAGNSEEIARIISANVGQDATFAGIKLPAQRQERRRRLIKYLFDELGRQAEEHKKQLEVQASAQASEIQAAQNQMRMLRRQAEEHRKLLEVQKAMQPLESQAAQEQMRMLQEKLRQMEMTQEAEKKKTPKRSRKKRQMEAEQKAPNGNRNQVPHRRA